MKIIALAGAYNSGKTTVLKQLVATLVGMGGRLATKVSYGRDERCSILYNGQVVGVCSGGDDDKTVKGNFRFFSKNGCTVGITACRSVSECASVAAVKTGALRLGRQLPYYVGKMREKRTRRIAVDRQTVQQLIAMI